MLNIKDREAHQLAQELAKATGETMTRAVTLAIRERLEKVKARRNAHSLANDLLKIGQRCAATRRGRRLSHAVFLYDENGAPK